MSDTFYVRVERTEWAEIRVDARVFLQAWDPEYARTVSEESGDVSDAVSEALHEIGVRDLMYDGDGLTVMEQDTEELIKIEGRA